AFEQLAVVLCAAPELDRSYERIYAFILDELGRRAACPELLSMLAAPSLVERIACRHALSRFGKLRRGGVLVARGDASELRQELHLADGLFGYLTGEGSDLASLCRETVAAPPPAGGEAPDDRVARLALALDRGELRAVGIWGPPQSGKEDLVHALAAALGTRLRHWVPPPSDDSATIVASLRDAAQEATVADALLWIAGDAMT